MPSASRPCAIAVAATLALCGCQQDNKADTAKGAAGGQILPGSASDAMLPYDTLRSQPPLAPKSDVEADKGERKGKPAAAAPDAAKEAEASGDAPAPAAPPASPSPAATP